MNKSILIVEDNPNDEELILLAFKKNNIDDVDLIIMPDGIDALDYIFYKGKYETCTHKFPSLIILDLKIPKLNGIEILNQIKKDSTTNNIPVIILSSSPEKNDIINSYKNNVNSYLIKPIDFIEFKTLIHYIYKFWIQYNSLPELVKQ